MGLTSIIVVVSLSAVGQSVVREEICQDSGPGHMLKEGEAGQGAVLPSSTGPLLKADGGACALGRHHNLQRLSLQARKGLKFVAQAQHTINTRTDLSFGFCCEACGCTQVIKVSQGNLHLHICWT